MKHILRHACRLFGTSSGPLTNSSATATTAAATPELISCRNRVRDLIKAGRNLCVMGDPVSDHEGSVFSEIVDSVVPGPHPPLETDTFFRDPAILYGKLWQVLRERQKIGQQPSGVLILTPSPDSGIQRYALCKKLDTKSRLRITRAGSSLQIYTSTATQVFCLPFSLISQKSNTKKIVWERTAKNGGW